MRKKLIKMHLQLPDLRLALEEFLVYKQAQGISKRTLDDYVFHVNRFLSQYQNLSTYDDLQKAAYQYLAQPCSAGYRNLKLKYFKAFFNWCVQEGYLPANPTAGIKKAKEDLSDVRHTTIESVKELLNVPDKRSYVGMRDYCFMLVQIDTGARPGELFKVLPDDLNLGSRELVIRPEVSKTRSGRTLVLSPVTCQALKRLLQMRPAWWGKDVPLFATEAGNPLNRHTWNARLRKYCKEAGVKVTPYGLRHTFAIEFLKAGGDPFSLQRILGHTDLTMTRRYVRLSQDDIREVHEKASPVQKLQQMGKRAPRRV
ncbi:MAG: tyrosine-type recombinase/integrase [Bacillota bacterium]